MGISIVPLPSRAIFAFAAATVLTGCGAGSAGRSDHLSPTAAASHSSTATASTSSNAHLVVGRAYTFQAPAGWVAANPTQQWEIGRPPDGDAPGLAAFDPAQDQWITFGEQPFSTPRSLAGWLATLKSTHTTDYDALCGETKVRTQSITLAGRPARLDAFACGTFDAVDVVVSTVTKHFGVVVTCHHDSDATPAGMAQKCRSWLQGLTFTD
jgi:hypothetical protein